MSNERNIKIAPRSDSLLDKSHKDPACEEKILFEMLRKSTLDIIFRLSRAVEYKDQETGMHVLRIGYFTSIIAQEMKLRRDFVEKILQASPMHDVGKIWIPDQILLKPGKLNASEWEVMKQHTTIGAKILEGSDSDILQLAEKIALTHHEKWDGSGYPGGLQGAGIPLAGRITALADAFDAMMSKRPYKQPFPLEKTIDIITEGKGSFFDPGVVDAFMAVKDEIMTIRDRFRD